MTNTLYAAPLEGVTGFAWRKAHADVFGGADKYFAPFLSPTTSHSFTTKETRDISQNEHNLVPQILASNHENFVWAAEYLKSLGYNEINLNLGCPSGTVVAKKKGCGVLRDLVQLDTLLDGIYSNVKDINISIKTRIGLSDASEWQSILAVYENYPISELIVHPRVKTQLYNGRADRALFLDTLNSTKLNLVYNGDVNDLNDEALSYGIPVMVGRGLISNPSLFREIKGGSHSSLDELKRFHDSVLKSYQSYISGDAQLLHKMKEFWHYFRDNFDVPDSAIKKILKSKHLSEYSCAVAAVLK